MPGAQTFVGFFAFDICQSGEWHFVAVLYFIQSRITIALFLFHVLH